MPVLFGTNLPVCCTDRANLTPFVSTEQFPNQSKLAGRLLPCSSQTYLVTLIDPVVGETSSGIFKKVQVKPSRSPGLNEMAAAPVFAAAFSGGSPQTPYTGLAPRGASSPRVRPPAGSWVNVVLPLF